MKDNNLSMKVYKNYNQIKPNIFIKLKENYEDCFGSNLDKTSNNHIFLLIENENLIGSAEYEVDKHLIWNYCLTKSKRGKYCTSKKKCSHYFINEIIKYIIKNFNHNNIYLFTDRQLKHKNSPDDIIKREKFYNNYGFKQIYIPQNDNVYNITGEKKIDNRNKDEKRLVKNYGNYLCLWKFHSSKPIISKNEPNNTFLSRLCFSGIFIAGLYLLNKNEFIL